MRVLVTGASGFVGRALVIALATSGHEVRAATRRRLGPFDFPAGVEIMPHADLASPIDWLPLLANVDAVVHLAGIAHVGSDVPDALYDRVNHVATAELAAAANRTGVQRFVFVSSVRAQSGPIADHVLTEADEPRPTDAYGRSKLAAEAAVRASDVPFAILRPVLIYGPGVKGNFAALAQLASLPLPLPFGSFHNKRSLLSNDNLVAATEFVLRDCASSGETYLVADPEPVSLAEIITSLRHGLDRSPALLPVPLWTVRAALKMVGQSTMWDRLSGNLMVDPKKLLTAGWRPTSDTKTAVEAFSRATRYRL
jgi:nucleoside-diphosphate-sugar epimerase